MPFKICEYKYISIKKFKNKKINLHENYWYDKKKNIKAKDIVKN